MYKNKIVSTFYDHNVYTFFFSVSPFPHPGLPTPGLIRIGIVRHTVAVTFQLPRPSRPPIMYKQSLITFLLLPMLIWCKSTFIHQGKYVVLSDIPYAHLKFDLVARA